MVGCDKNHLSHLQNKFGCLPYFESFGCLHTLIVFVDSCNIQAIPGGRSDCFPNSGQPLAFDTFTIVAITVTRVKDENRYV